eukprot:222472-Rhodomonas_salina.1
MKTKQETKLAPGTCMFQTKDHNLKRIHEESTAFSKISTIFFTAGSSGKGANLSLPLLVRPFQIFVTCDQ